MKLEKALLLVDVQNDFCPGGGLAAPEGDEIIPVLNKYVQLFSKKNLPIFVSRDCHPKKTKHSKGYRGPWPSHCVQNTRGARSHPKIKLPQDTIILSKRIDNDKNSYSAFHAADFNGVEFLRLLKLFGINELFVGGFAVDYCIKWSALDALRLGFKVRLLADAMKGINITPKDSRDAVDKMVSRGATKVTFEKLSKLMSDKGVTGCDHVGLFTAASDKLVSFYTEKLGFRREKEGTLPKSLTQAIFRVSSDCKFIRLVSGNVKIEVFEPTSIHLQARLDNSVGYNHWGYCVGDKEKFLRKLRRKKVTIIEVKRDSHSIYFVRDPDGNRIEIRELQVPGLEK